MSLRAAILELDWSQSTSPITEMVWPHTLAEIPLGAHGQASPRRKAWAFFFVKAGA